MAEYQISRKYGTDGWLMWEDIDDGYMTGFPSGRTLDSGARYRLRVKPTFEPGYFQCTGTPVVTAYRTNDVVWMASQGEIDRTDCTWVRVNVTPVETD